MNPFTIITFLLITAVTGNNISDILSQVPDYSVYNTYLTQTRLNDQINNQGTVTVLVLNNTAVTKYLANQPLFVIKSALSIHVLLDYFDYSKLLSIGGGSAITTTLYQTTGTAIHDTGFVNITDLPNKRIGFGSKGYDPLALYTKSVKQIPYNISVLEIDSPILPLQMLEGIAAAPLPSPSLSPSPSPSVSMSPSPSPSKLSDLNINITSVLVNAGCFNFARIIYNTGVLSMFEKAELEGFTLFAPKDSAFKVQGLPNIDNLSNNDLISLLKYHAISNYVPKASLINEKNPVDTLASNNLAKFNFTIHVKGDLITIDSGVDISRIESMVFDKAPVSIYRIDNVLLPINMFSETVTGPAPAPVIASRPNASSPEAPKISSPADGGSAPADGGPAPADSPTADLEKSGASNGSSGINDLMLLLAIVMVSIIVG
ncbi:fasciclin-like arabinogalactan protein 8 [Rutidosis leptorrhynchoides]|uniref:fasciclin-like arabinogalactan protein 8 n=1 Tax=Rutidosis leptorrhynchoides TaxID=125765 RepID=UPI003A9A4EBB